MPKCLLGIACLLAVYAPFASAGVTVTKPANGATVQGPVPYVASATTSCSKGVASMGIYTAPGQLAYVVNGDTLNTNLSLAPGTYQTVVEEWDHCGGATTTPVTVTVTGGSGVYIASPGNNSKVSSPAHFAATATTSCSKGVGSMGIYTAPYQLAYVSNGANLNTNLSLSAGTYNATIVEWDNCGGAAAASVTVSVTSGGGSGNTFWNLQSNGGWAGYGQGPPNFVDCNPCGPQITWSMYQGIKSPSLSGSASKYSIGGTGPYWDALWNNHLIGDGSSQGLPDKNHTLVPTLHTFTYDVYFYGSNLEASQAEEFDINQFFGGMGFIWGHECRIAGGHEWDIWDNVNQHWVATGISCYPNDNSWNHLTIHVERTGDNKLHYQSITLNGVTNNLDRYYDPGSAPGWYGVTINYQMDGNSKQTPYTVFLDKLAFTYQ